MKLDSHQHFWRYDRLQYPWIPPGSPLERDWLPADLATVQTLLGFDGSIAVQARQTVAESDWLLGLADADPRIRGVVGWVDLRSERVGEDLDRLCRHPRFVGVRHVVQDEPDPSFMLQPDFLRGLAALAGRGVVYDFLVYPHQLTACIQVADRFPEQSFVLDHLAKPAIRKGEIEPWSAQVRELARRPNVVCKVSGMVTEADHARWRPQDFSPYLAVVSDAFGPDRLMFGSDWPVCLLAARYEQVGEIVDHHLSGWDAEARDSFWGGTAARVYLGSSLLG